jgi:hypothetical protein
MATITCTNQKASPAAKGQAIVVTLDNANSLTQLPQLVKGQFVNIDSSGADGTVYSIDNFGHSFMVKPIRPEVALGTGTVAGATNIFDVADTVTVTL